MTEILNSIVCTCKWHRRPPQTQEPAIKIFLGATLSPDKLNLDLINHLVKEDQFRVKQPKFGLRKFNPRISTTNNFKNIKVIKLWKSWKIQKKSQSQRLWMTYQRERRFLRRTKISPKKVLQLTGNLIVCQ